jgi:hypothetical protein
MIFQVLFQLFKNFFYAVCFVLPYLLIVCRLRNNNSGVQEHLFPAEKALEQPFYQNYAELEKEIV